MPGVFGMRVERVFWCNGSQPNPRETVAIETTETYFCEDPECERTHDNPEIKWDSRVTRLFAEVNKLEDAERMVELLRKAEL